MDNKKKMVGIGIIAILIFGLFIVNRNTHHSDYSSYQEDDYSTPYTDEDDGNQSSNEITCPLCRGNRMVTMQGQTIECPICYGNATISQERYNEVTELKNCPTVDPFGTTCQICGGTGQASALTYAQYLKDPEYNNPDTNPDPNPSTGEGCRQCRIPGAENVKGNGQCSSCNGAGTISGYDLDRMVCNQCAGKTPNGEGDGRCRYCNGTGWR